MDESVLKLLRGLEDRIGSYVCQIMLYNNHSGVVYDIDGKLFDFTNEGDLIKQLKSFEQ